MFARKQWQLDRGTLLRLLLVLLAWGGLTAIVAELVPYQPRLRYVAPEGSEIAFAPDSFRIALLKTKPEDTVQVIHMETGRSCLTMQERGENYRICTPNGRCSVEHFNSFLSFAVQKDFSPDNKFLAMCNLEDLLLVDLTTGWYLRQPSVRTFKFSPDSTLMAFFSAKDSNPIAVWDLVEKRARAGISFEEALDCHDAFRFSRDSRSFLTFHNTKEIGVWDLDTCRQRILVEADAYEVTTNLSNFESFDLAPDGKTLAYRVYEGKDAIEIDLLNVASGKVLTRLPNARYPLAFAPDGRSLTTDVFPAGIKTWDVATGLELNCIQHEGKFCYLDAAGTLLALSRPSETTFWDMSVRPARKIYEVPHTDSSTPGQFPLRYPKRRLVIISPDGYLVASQEEGDAHSSLVVMDLKTQEERLRLPGEYFKSGEPAFSPDSRFLAIHKVWPEKDRPMLTLRTFLKRGRGSVGDAHTVEIWDLTTGRRHAVLPGCWQAGFWPDGKSLATLSEDDQAVEVWDVPLKKPLWKILAWSLGLGLYVFWIRWICGSVTPQAEACDYIAAPPS